MGAYDEDGYTLRCHGCLRAIARCMHVRMTARANAAQFAVLVVEGRLRA